MTAAFARLTAALADRYRLERELGQGGMATVYLALDVKHDRKVAIKVLRPELSAVLGAERFLAEIKTTANLQHPHILGLIDSGECEGLLYYVMPFVEGETLRAKLEREQQLPVKEAVRLATEVASALDHAHKRGIVHRDIKPENILLQDGQALVADFGIALAVQQSGGQRMTQTGLSLGTPSYMSPEQAMGEKTITARSDVYALGAVTYEMLMGDPPFGGASAQAIVSQVLTVPPRPIRDFRPNVPESVEHAVLTALEKLPADRWPSARAFAEALEGAAPAPRAPAGTRALPAARAGARRAWPWLAGALLVAGVAWTATRLAGRAAAAPVEARVVRFSVELGPTDELDPSSQPLVTPDGRTLFVKGGGSRAGVMFVHPFDRIESTTLSGVHDAARPFLSPDGKWLAYTDATAGKLFKVPVTGGTPVPIAESHWGGGTWARDGTIIFTAIYNQGLARVSQDGGPVTRLTTPDTTRGELAHWWPQVLPDGRHVLFCVYRTPLDKSTIEVLDTKTGERRVLLEGGLHPHWLPSGHLLYSRGSTVMAIAFDAATLRTHGSAVPVLEGVAGRFVDGQAAYDVGADGTLAFVSDSLFQRAAITVETDRRGVERPLLPEPGSYHSPRLSPDGTRLAFTEGSGTDEADVWIRDLARGGTEKLSGSPGADFGGAWTPDGRELVFDMERKYFQLFRRPADLSRPATALFADDVGDKILSGIGRGLVLFSYSIPPGSELWTVPLDGRTAPQRYIRNESLLGHPVLSPDGRWMAYDGNESGTVEVYVQSFPDPSAARFQVSAGGGSEPLWTKGGRELVYRKGDSVMAVTVDPATGRPGKPTRLFSGPFEIAPSYSFPRSWDASADGERFVLVKTAPELRVRRVSVVLNWLEELRRKVPTS